MGRSKHYGPLVWLMFRRQIGGTDGHQLPDLTVTQLLDLVAWVESFHEVIEEAFPNVASFSSKRTYFDKPPSLLMDNKKYVDLVAGKDTFAWINNILTSGEGISLDTFVKHTFVVRTVDENATTTTTGTAPRASFKIAEHQLKQVYMIRDGVAIEGPDPEAESTRSSQHGAGEITKMCQDKDVEASKNNRLSRQVILKQLTECLTSQTANFVG